MSLPYCNFSSYVFSCNYNINPWQEVRIPLQIWVAQNSNGLIVEEGQGDGELFSDPFT